MSETFVFTVDSALLGELGERLVTSVHIALTELVKNAYDADAPKVTITIEYDDAGRPDVEVADTGSGMTLEEVRNYWMKIGTVNKQRNPTSPKFGRPRTGAKGIGRFACRRLGTRLQLTTCSELPKKLRTKEHHYETTEIDFNWLKFEPGHDVATIQCPGKSHRHRSGKTGTTLRISGALEDEWKQGGFDYIRRQLAVLASNQGARRRGFDEDTGFNIDLDAPGFTGGIGDLREQIIEASWGTLEARVNKDGYAECELSAKRIGHRKIRSKRQFPDLVGVTLRVGIISHKKDDFRKPSVLSKQSAKDITDEWGGVQVRYNRFRIYPYGDPEDDWLEIDSDRGRRIGRPDKDRDDNQLFTFAAGLGRIDPGRVMLSLLSSKSFLGGIEVNSSTEKLQPKADRLGFVNNEAFQQLVEFGRFTIDWATIWRDYYIQTTRTKETNEAREELSQVLGKQVTTEQIATKAVRYLKSQIDHLVTYLPDEKQQAETKRILHQTTKALETSVADDKEKLRRLRLIASASTLTLLFSHEIKSLLGTLDITTHTLKKLLSKISDSEKPRIIELAQDIEAAKQRFRDLVELTALVGAVGKQTEPTDLNLHQHVNRAVKCFDLIAKDYNLKIDTSNIPTNAVVGPLVPGELYAVLLNVLSNAIKSVIAAGKKKRISFIAHIQGKHVVMDVMDTGVGLSTEQFDAVFATFVSDPEGQLYEKLERNLNPQDQLIFGQGSGLGLSIVRDILESRGGDAEFVEPEDDWSATLRLTLP